LTSADPPERIINRLGAIRRRAGLAAFAVAIALPVLADDTPAPAPAATPAAAPASAAAAGNTGTPDQIGRSIVVVNDVDGQSGDAPPKRIAVNDNILFAEDITTGADAKTVIEFRDGSTFELGPDAVARIDSFIFNPEESTSHKAVDVSRGVFRYVSGFVSSDQDATVKTPAGEMGIRGSVVEGIVDPSVPNFLYVGEGNATFTNSAGSSTVAPGGAIAVPSATTAPMAPAAMPPAVAAQAVEVIDRRLPPPAAMQNREAANDTWLQQTGAANLVPAAAQRQREAALGLHPMPAPAAAPGSMAGELPMLAEANRIGMFRGNPRTPEQDAFLTRVARENPRAAAILDRHRAAATAMHRASVTAGTALVIRGVGHAAQSAEVMRRVTAAAVHANPGAATAIARHANESYRGPDRGELNRRPEERRPDERRPEERRPEERRTEQRRPEERRAEPRVAPHNREEHANPRAERAQPQRDTGTKPPRREPPRREGRERGNNKDRKDNQR
jgi:FecR protein